MVNDTLTEPRILTLIDTSQLSHISLRDLKSLQASEGLGTALQAAANLLVKAGGKHREKLVKGADG